MELGAVLLGGPLAALIMGYFVFHRWAPRLTHLPVLASCLAVALAALELARQVYHGRTFEIAFFRWLHAGPLSVEFGFRADGLTASVLAMVAVVGGLIHLYAVGYMKRDPGFSRFFLYLHFFFFSMIGLLTSDNYLQLYLFWEGVGLASFLLIGFWYEKPAARAAAWKAFLTNRVGDAGFLIALALMLKATGTVRFEEFFARASSLSEGSATTIALLLFWGACAKSAQFPLHVWLPDAMEGPTPVSALMHAATMVTAGVFLMARSWPLLQLAPDALTVIAWVGALTALGAALFAAVERDLKRILAYSTVSHLGLMMLAIGCGDPLAAVFHLIAHGVFKALLFLCAGNVLHGLEKSAASIDDAGGLARSLPVTYAAFFVGALALGGFPPLAGFFSKDMILEALLGSPLGALKPIAPLISFGSSFYIFRMLFLTFLGERPRQTGPKAHAHEGGFLLLGPVAALAALCALAGAIGPAGVLHKMMGLPHEPHFDWVVALGSLGFAALGAGAAHLLTMKRPAFDWDWRAGNPALAGALTGELGYQSLAARVAGGAGAVARFLSVNWDKNVWDRWTEAVSDSVQGLGEGVSGFSRGLVNEYLWWMTATAAAAVMVALCI